MPFEIENTAKLKITDVVVLSQKNRQPDDNPGVKITIECALPNYALAHFDGSLRGMLFQKKPGTQASGQQSLENVPSISDLPHLSPIGQKLGWFNWDFEGTGYRLTIACGLGGKSDLVLDDCTIGHFRLHGNEGGTVDARFDIESEDASEKHFGRLAKLKSTEVEATLTAPEVVQEDIEDDKHPSKTGAASKAKLDASGNSPFPKSGQAAEKQKRTGNEAGDAFAAAHTH